MRAQAVWKPLANFKLALSADYTNEHPHIEAGQPTNTLSNTFGAPLDVITNPPKWNWTANLGSDLPNRQPLHTGGVSAVVTWNITDALILKSITSARQTQYDYYIDIDATPLQIGDVQLAARDDATTQKTQLYYKAGR